MIQTFLINALSLINSANEAMFSPLDNFIGKLGLISWAEDAIIDSFHMLPFLFLIFLIIEFVEYFYADKINKIAEHSKKAGPLVGSLAASFPQCGFSIIASTLYTERLITKGTLISVYLATSDEAIPVILSDPTKVALVVPLLLTKIFIAIIAGYAIDMVLKTTHTNVKNISADKIEYDEGCCGHHIHKRRKRDLILHPLMHTLNVFVFIICITFCLNYLVFKSGGEENLGQYFLNNSVFQPVITAIVGLIPNCAISIAITLLYLKGAIGFGSVISGLCSSAGLGLLVLFKKNGNLKDTLTIVFLLLFISIVSGILIQTFYN